MKGDEHIMCVRHVQHHDRMYVLCMCKSYRPVHECSVSARVCVARWVSNDIHCTHHLAGFVAWKLAQAVLKLPIRSSV